LFDAHDRQDRAEAWNVQVTDKVVTPQIDTPQTVPLHPAAELYWRSRGYL
jgi:hypothetical protein